MWSRKKKLSSLASLGDVTIYKHTCIIFHIMGKKNQCYFSLQSSEAERLAVGYGESKLQRERLLKDRIGVSESLLDYNN